MENQLQKLVLSLFDIQALKFGEFKLKSGILSPVYFDLRVIISYPDVMCKVSEFLYEAAALQQCKFDSVCGVPYTALPLATLIAANHKYPMLLRRKEAKDYGTKKIIEGHFKKGDVCLIVEDVVTSGGSVLETVEALKDEGIVVKDAVVLLDREQGGSERIAAHGVKLHSVCKISTLLDILLEAGRLDLSAVNDVRNFITSNNTLNGSIVNNTQLKEKKQILSHDERAAKCTHPVTRKLFRIMHEKKSNLAFSADVTSFKELYQLADDVGPHICILKTHIDIVDDFTNECISRLQELADKHNFLIFEDRKFADIGNTVKHQYQSGVYRISKWAHIINAHSLPGPGVIAGLKQASEAKERGCLLVGEMSSKGNLAKDDYTKATVQMANDNSDFVIGFICQSKLSDNPEFIHMTPGVKLEQGDDTLGQNYLSPAKMIQENGSDVIIVGRGILAANDPVQQAKLYQQAGYNAYQEML